jgi:drug/metabolite transporter (DMT)-like permease
VTLRVLFAMLILAVLWGSAFPAIKIGLGSFSGGELALFRYLVASLSFIPFLLLTRSRLRPQLRDIPYFFLLGVVGITIYHVSLNYSELKVSPGAASLIIATAPAITAIIAYFLLSERLPGLGWLGIAVSFAGIALIVLGSGKELGISVYDLLTLLSATVTAFYAVLQTRMFARYKAVEVTAFSAWAGTVPMLVFLPGLAGALSHASTEAVLATVYIGIFPAAIAYALFAYALSKAPVTVVTSFLYTVPVFSFLFSWLLLGEVPRWLTLIGGVIAIAGIVVVNRAKRRARRLEPQAPGEAKSRTV